MGKNKCVPGSSYHRYKQLRNINIKVRYYNRVIGSGVETQRDIERGVCICQFHGNIINEERRLQLSPLEKQYVVRLGPGLFLDCMSHAFMGRCYASMANSALGTGFRNNATLRANRDGASLWSTRKIFAKEQIFYAYGRSFNL